MPRRGPWGSVVPRTNPALRDAGIELPALRHRPQHCLGLTSVGNPDDFASRRTAQVLRQPAFQFTHSYVYVVIVTP
jgi:hypothetical protein